MRYVAGSDYDAVWDAQDQRERRRIARTKVRRAALRTWHQKQAAS
jgi:hypothetical protein